jgi:hypothetical protein
MLMPPKLCICPCIMLGTKKVHHTLLKSNHFLDSHCGDEDVNIGLCCNAVWTCREIPPFRRNILLPPSGLKYFLSKRWFPPVGPHCSTTQNINTDTFTAVRTSYPIQNTRHIIRCRTSLIRQTPTLHNVASVTQRHYCAGHVEQAAVTLLLKYRRFKQ